MPSKTQSVLIGAVVYIVLGVLIQVLFPGGGAVVGILGCLVSLSSGLAAVWHYTSTQNLTIPAGQGAGMGAIAGLVGALIGVAIGFILISAGILPEPLEVARDQMENSGMSEAEIDNAMSMVERFSNPVFSGAIAAVIGTIAGAISGAIGAVVFKKGGDVDEFVTEM